MSVTETQQRPPAWPLKVIRLFVRSDYLEEIEGDMLEEYDYHLEKYSKRKASYLYIREVFKLIRPNLIKSIYGDQKLNYMGTLKNYTKVAFRNIKKHKTYAAIKIGGFSIGIAISLLISLFVLDEVKMDQHLQDKSVYRLIRNSEEPGFAYRGVSLPPVLGPSLENDYPDIKQTGRILVFDGFGDAGGNLFRPEETKTSIFEERFGYADPSVLEMLEIELIHGDPKTALKEPRSLILSQTKANKYYPNENPVGKTVFINEKVEEPYVIHGVYQDLDDSHLQSVDFFFTLTGKEFWEGEQTNWCCYNYVTFVEFRNFDDAAQFAGKLKAVHDGYFVTYEREVDPKFADLIEEYYTLEMQHVSDIYLYSNNIYGFLAMGDIRLVNVFSGVAIFILLLACVNFINLTTANSAQRSKEIGLRKAVGAGKQGIMHQFLIEAMVLSFISVAIGVLLAGLFMPVFNDIASKSMAFPLDQPIFYVLLLAFALVIGLLSGFYPSLHLAGIETLTVLRGQMKLNARGNRNYLRSGLVVFQFAISMILIAGAFIVYKQMKFILDKDLGYDKEQVLLVHGTESMGDGMITFKEQLEQLPEVEAVSFSNSMPVAGTHRNGNTFWVAGRKNIDIGISGQNWSADEDYFDVLDLEVVQGRIFSNDLVSDSNSVVINEAMAEQLGLEDPLDARIQNWWEWKVIGVIENFNYDNLREEVRPLMIKRTEQADMVAIKMNTEEVKEMLTEIEGIWDNFNPNQRIRMDFLDQRFASMYENVERIKTLFLAFAVLGVIVACLGLFGLSVYTVAQRNKEMTIRKVLGASLQSILGLLTIDYLKLIVLAMIIGIPFAWYLAERWLEDYIYRIPFLWDSLVWSGILLIIVAMLVVGYQSLKSALSNPALGLRNE